MDFLTFATNHGLIIEHLDYGRIVRCKTQSHRSKQNGAYYYAGDWGWCMDWAADNVINLWRADGVIDDDDFKKQVKQSTQKYKKDRAKLNARASKEANELLGKCKLELSPYLAKKGFPDMCANVMVEDGEKPVLIVPMYKNNELVGCQKISYDGDKKFIYGQITNDACFIIGNGKKIFFVEGYVSGLSLHQILQVLKIDCKIYVCFSAQNLLRFAKRIDGIVIADNDESGTGERVAKESGRNWWMPPKVGYDINDYHLEAGIFRVSQELKKVLYTRNEIV